MSEDRKEAELVDAARAAARHAYAPYSRYAVGAAVETGEGAVVTAANVENASYGLSLCAETAAIAAAASAGARTIIRLAVAAERDGEVQTPMPCGRCRQVLAEFARGDAVVLVATREGTVARYRLDELLPHTFAFLA